MAIRDEIRILKTNTLEEFRQKTNELSIDKVGDNKLLANNITDKVYGFTADANQTIFEISNGRFEVLPEQTIDRTTGVAEAFRFGAVVVKSEGVELIQGLDAGQFIVPNYSLKVTLTGSPSIPAEFVENAVLTQSGGFSGTLLSADSNILRFKSFTGTFNTGQNLGIPHTDPLKRISAADISSKTDIDNGHAVAIQLITPATASDSIQIIATSLVDAINELQDDIGVTENLATVSANAVNAINEHETDLFGTGNVSFSGLSSTGFQDAVEELRTELGNHSSLGTDVTSNVVGAVNEIETAVRGSTANYTLDTTANDLVSAINEHEADIGDMSLTTTASDLTDAINELDALQGNNSLTTTGTTLTAAVNELDAELGTISAGAMGTTASTVSGAIAEHETQIGNVSITSISSSNDTITGALSQLHSELGSATLTTSASTHTGAINEHESDIGNMTLTGLSATDLSAGLRELASEKLDITNSSAGGQSLSGNINYTTAGGNGTFDFGPGTTLDISDGTLLVSAAGGVANFGSAFLNLDGEVSAMGLQVDRDYITPSGTMTNHDVKLQWNESLVATKPERAWQLIGMEDDGSTNTADILTFYNAKDLIQNNAEAGISVDWDATNQNFDFNVDDFTITLGTGPISGSVTVTNLSNATFNTTLDNNSIALGTKTTGNYIATIAGTTNEIEVSGSGSETAAVTIGLPNDVTIGNNLIVTDYTRTAGLRVGTTGTDPGDGNLAISNDLTVGNDVTITGDLTVNGTQTTLNTSTLEVEDTLVLAGNNLVSEPSSGGFGLEVGPITSPSGVASNVTGAHSIVYNYATDQWEADGSLILSTATLATPQVEGSDFGPGDNLTFTAGSGLSESVTGFAVTYTNTDRGSSQNIFKNVASDSGTAVADNNNDTLTITGGTFIDTSVSGDTLTINHSDTSSQSSVNNSGNTFIQDITLDSHGHITGIGSGSVDPYDGWNLTVGGTARGLITENEVVSFAAGTALTVGYSATNNVITFNHADTSSVSNINASGTTFVQDLTFDTHGHVTAASTGSFTLGDGQLTISGGTLLSGSTTFTANQTGNSSVTINHDNVSRSDTSSSQSRTYGQSFTAIDSITTSSQGHITAINTKTVTLPASDNTNTIPNNATITISAGTNLTGGGNFTTDQSSAETITLNMQTGGVGAGTYGSTANGTKIDEITIDAYGRVTSISTGATGTATVNDTGTPAITSNGSTPSLNSGISAAEIRSLIGAGTSSTTGTVTSVATGNGISGGTITSSGTLTVGAGNGLSQSSTGLLMSGSFTGTFTASADVVAYSDKKLKDNIETLDGSKVFDMRGVSFNRNDQDGKLSSGVIAQELEQIAPELIHESEDGTKGVAYGNTVGYLIEAIKLLKAEIEELKSINKGIEK